MSLWVIVLFYEHCANVCTLNNLGQTPMIYSALNKYEDNCIYLTLSSKNIDYEDENTHMNVFSIYLKQLVEKFLFRLEDLQEL